MLKSKKPLKKVSLRLFADDVDIIKEVYPGNFGSPGINEVVREVVHSWAELKLRNRKGEHVNEPS